MTSRQAVEDRELMYNGVADCVRCFFCGGDMRNWEQGDDPWIEHARLFPHCQYVKQCKGQGFIDTCLLANGLENFGSSEMAANQWYIDQQTLIPETVSASTSSNVPSRSNDNNFLNKEVQPIEEATIQPTNQTDSYLASRDEEYPLTHQSSGTNHEAELEDLSGLSRQPEERSSNIINIAHSSNITDRETIGRNQNSNIAEVEQSSNTTGREPNSNTTSLEQNLKTTGSADINQIPGVASNTTFENDLAEVNQRLSDENELLKQQITCKVCMDNEICMVFLPCGHMVCCFKCADQLRTCAVCRCVIKGTVRALMY
ncbi:PIAP-like protein [Mya arenaria]|uniref:PIAP-like protein n=1 Tax=Mya arenaria TaxID=6604 RepID=A0ABY7ECH1_MYAAR|nr:PIAP-like protein [Mya arenaria]